MGGDGDWMMFADMVDLDSVLCHREAAGRLAMAAPDADWSGVSGPDRAVCDCGATTWERTRLCDKPSGVSMRLLRRSPPFGCDCDYPWGYE